MATSKAASAAVELLATQGPYILTVILTFTVAWVFQILLQDNGISKIPLIGSEIRDKGMREEAFRSRAREMYLEGYQKIKGGLFRIPAPAGMTPGGSYCDLRLLTCGGPFKEFTTVVIHPRFLQELSHLPDDQVSFNGSIMEVRYCAVPLTIVRQQADELTAHALEMDEYNSRHAHSSLHYQKEFDSCLE